MSEIIRKHMYVSAISGSVVTLSVESFDGTCGMASSIRTAAITVPEAVPESTFWGSVAACGRFLVTIQKRS